MATFSSWAWLGGNISSPITQSNLGGTFVPVSNYTEEFILQDGNNNGVIGDLDGTSQPVANDGVQVNGTFHQFEQFTTWTSSTITYADGTSSDIVVHVYRLDNGDLTYRLSDTEVQQVKAAGYTLKDVQSIQLGNLSSFSSRFEGLDPTNHNDFLCFAAGTLIETYHGNIPAEDLRVGDLVYTRDASFLPVQWTGQRHLTKTDLEANPNIRPIRIRAGALGPDTPSDDLVISPQHRVLVRSKIAHRLFGTYEVLVAAKHLLPLDGIEIAEDLTEVTYIHFLFSIHQIVVSNGAETESFYPGPQALKTLHSEQVAKIVKVLPQLKYLGEEYPLPGARRLLTGQEARKLAYRHDKNDRNLVMQAH